MVNNSQLKQEYPPEIVAQKEGIEKLFREMEAEGLKVSQLKFPHYGYYFHFFLEKLNRPKEKTIVQKMGNVVLWGLSILSILLITLFVWMSLDPISSSGGSFSIVGFIVAFVIWLWIDSRNSVAVLPYFMAEKMITNKTKGEWHINRSDYFRLVFEIWDSTGLTGAMRWLFPGVVMLTSAFISDDQISRFITDNLFSFLINYYSLGIVFVRFRDLIVDWRLDHILKSAPPESREAIKLFETRMTEMRAKVRPMIQEIADQGYNIDWKVD